MAERSKILVVEDEENDVFLLRRALERAGVSQELMVARDGQEAVEFLSRTAANPIAASNSELVLVLLDLKMPRLNGFDVLTWLGQQPQFKKLPVVVLSSSAHEADKERARKLGAQDYRVKPADFVSLVEMVRDLKTRWLMGAKPVESLSSKTG